MSRGRPVLALLALLAGCATSVPRLPRAAAPAVAQSADPSLPLELRWFRIAAERPAIYAEVYRSATQAVRAAAAGLPARSWGVILDIDETVLDNSEYQQRLALAGRSYTQATWDAWVRERRSTALPGAKEFIDEVLDELHGRIVFVTNRSQDECADTEANLRAQQLRFDLVLCDADGSGDKNPRFQSVIAGAAGIPALNVLLWIGDNIQDFPALDQRHPGEAAKFGVSYFVLPNPMYGSWQMLPDR